MTKKGKPEKYEEPEIKKAEIKVNPDLKEESIAQIAAHLLYITGGHPGCIAKTLEIYQQDIFSMNRFLKEYQEELWEKVICKFVEDGSVYSFIANNKGLVELERPFFSSLLILPIYNSSFQDLSRMLAWNYDEVHLAALLDPLMRNSICLDHGRNANVDFSLSLEFVRNCNCNIQVPVFLLLVFG